MEKEGNQTELSPKQNQIHNILFSKEPGWQEIIYDLVNSDQLDPWDINITVLTDSFLEKITKLEEADFFISGKVLLAAALLLRIKSELILTKYMKSVDEILFGKKEEKKYSLERIELEDDIPELIPKSPIPRARKVTLQELMESLNKAIVTENRRIKKEITNRNAFREAGISLPKKKYSIKDKVKEIYQLLISKLKKEKIKKINFSNISGQEKDERIAAFTSLLHLENQKKVWLHQEGHLGDIDVWIHESYLKNNPDPLEEIKKYLDQMNEEVEKSTRKKQEN